MFFETEMKREMRYDPGFTGRMVVLVWIPSAVGVMLTVATFVLLLLVKDNALCK